MHWAAHKTDKLSFCISAAPCIHCDFHLFNYLFCAKVTAMLVLETYVEQDNVVH